MRLPQEVSKQIFAEVDQLDEILKGIEALLDERGKHTPVLTVAQRSRLQRVSERLINSGR